MPSSNRIAPRPVLVNQTSVSNVSTVQEPDAVGSSSSRDSFARAGGPVRVAFSPNQQKAAQSVCVVGAGVAGLQAARELQAQGYSVTVLERQEQVGGRTRSITLDLPNGEKLLVDTGANYFPGGEKMYLEMKRVTEELGLASEVMKIRSTLSGVVRNGDVKVLDLTKAQTLITSGLLKWHELPGALARVTAGGIAAKVAMRGVDPSDVTTWSRIDDETADQFTKLFSGTALERLLNGPTLRAMAFQELDESSRVLLHWVTMFFEEAKQGLFTFKGGMGTLAEKMADDVMKHGGTIRTQMAVENVAFDPATKKVAIQTPSGSETFDFAVLAVPAPVLEKIYTTGSAQERAVLTAFKPSMGITLFTDRKLNELSHHADLSALSGVVLPAGEGSRGDDVPHATIAQLNYRTNDNNMLGQSFTVYLRAETAAELYRLHGDNPSAEVVFDTIRDDVAAMMGPAVVASIEAAKTQGYAPSVTTSFKDGVPVHQVGRSAAVKEYWAQHRATKGHVVFAGDWMNFYGVDGAIASGRRAASGIVETTRSERTAVLAATAISRS